MPLKPGPKPKAAPNPSQGIDWDYVAKMLNIGLMAMSARAIKQDYATIADHVDKELWAYWDANVSPDHTVVTKV